MGRVIALASLWILVGCSCVRSESEEVRCELAAFLENPDGSHPVLIDSGPLLTDSPIRSCEEGETCAKLAQKQALEGTENGNFSLTVDDQNGYTIGDVLCDKADAVQENVRHKKIHIYWRLCGSEWQPTAFWMPDTLCCEDGLYVPCWKFMKTEL